MISAVAIAAASLVSVAYAADAPTMNVTAEKITDFTGTYAGYAEFANDYGLDIYSVKFTGTGIAMTTTTSGMAKKLSGDSIVGATIKFSFDCAATFNDEWVFEKLNTITPPTLEDTNGTLYTCAMVGTSPLYPAAKTAATVTAADETPVLEEIVFAVDPSSPVTLTFQDCAINVGTFSSDSCQSTVTYKMTDSSLAMSAATLVLPVASAPTTYTYTFKNADGTADISSADIEEGATVTAPTAPTVAGKDFVGWATSVGGAVVSVDSTAKADTTYYAVYEDSAPAYVEIPADTTQAQKVADPAAKTYKDYDDNDVTLTKSYAIARFVTAIDSAKTYTLHAEATSGSKDFDMNFAGIEVSGIANFITIVKNAPDGTVLTIREQ